MEEEKCPTCGEDNFNIEDYEEDFNDLLGTYYKSWKCKCCNGHDFMITYCYARTKVIVE